MVAFNTAYEAGSHLYGGDQRLLKCSMTVEDIFWKPDSYQNHTGDPFPCLLYNLGGVDLTYNYRGRP